MGKKLATRWEGPYTITRRTGPVNYEIKMGKDKPKVYAGRLKLGKLSNEFPTKVSIFQEGEAQDHPTLSNDVQELKVVEAKEPTTCEELESVEKRVEVKVKAKPKKPILVAKPVRRYNLRS